jgi:single-stranded-DNA-specific exonuclease
MDQAHLSEDDVAFMITPRINAASRMGSPEDAFKLLSTTDAGEALLYTAHLEKINNERKGVVASVVKDAKKHLSEREVGEVIVVGNPEWRPALLGLVANSLVEEYSRPVFVWGRDGEGVIKGSCRSYNGYDLYTLMDSAKDHFIEFGGHTGAGGFSATLENISVLEQILSDIFTTGEVVVEKEKEKTYPISIKDIGEDLWRTVSLLSPFGMENPKPVFEIKADVKAVKQFGKEANHLEVCLTDGGKDIKCISFFSSPATYSLLPTAKSCSLLGTLEKSYFRGRPEIRLRIVNIESW